MRPLPSLLFVLLLPACSAPEATRNPSPLVSFESLADGRLTAVDLSHSLSETSPHWPGEDYEPFSYRVIATIEEDGVLSGSFSMPEHLGTHLDAPNHFVAGQASVDQFELIQLLRPMVIIDVAAQVEDSPDHVLSVEDIEEWESENGSIPARAVVFLSTGWSRYWSNFDRYKNADEDGTLHFPGFSPQAAQFLVAERRVAGLGIDTLSVDYGPSSDFQVHHIVHGSGGYHLENAANLERVPVTGAWVLIAPIKIANGTGGPARVWAVF